MTGVFLSALAGGVCCLVLEGLVGGTSLDERSSAGEEVVDDSAVTLQSVLLVHAAVNPKPEPQEVLQSLLPIQTHILHSELMLHSLTYQTLCQFIHLLLDAFDDFRVEEGEALWEAVGDELEEEVEVLFGLCGTFEGH